MYQPLLLAEVESITYVINELNQEAIMKRVTPILGLTACLILFGCSDPGQITADVENSSWRLMRIEIAGSDTIVIPTSESYTMEFHNSKDVRGLNHCNRYQAKYDLASDGSIFFREITETEMACRPPTSNAEFTSGLLNAKSLQVIRDHLRLYYAEGKRVLLFVRQP